MNDRHNIPARYVAVIHDAITGRQLGSFDGNDPGPRFFRAQSFGIQHLTVPEIGTVLGLTPDLVIKIRTFDGLADIFAVFHATALPETCF